MNISVQFIIVLAAACVFVAQAAPELRVRTKQQRPTRGFKNVEMMTARGFGKRDRPTRTERDVGDEMPPTRDSRGVPAFKSSSIGIARDFGKRSPENLEESNTKITFHPKDWPLMVAERFGKRSPNSENYDQEEEMRVTRTAFKPNAKVLIARGYGKRNLFVDNESVYAGEQPEESFWETLEQPAEEMTDARDEKRDRLKIRRDRVVPKTTKQSVESAKEGVKLRHTVDEKKRRKLTKSSPRSVKSMKITKGDKEKLKSTGKKQKSTKSLGSSITVDTFTKEMVKNPDFARTVVRRFIDHNLDGYLTEDELLKNTA